MWIILGQLCICKRIQQIHTDCSGESVSACPDRVTAICVSWCPDCTPHSPSPNPTPGLTPFFHLLLQESRVSQNSFGQPTYLEYLCFHRGECISNIYSANYQMPGVGQTERQAKVLALAPSRMGTLQEAATGSGDS